MGMRQQDRSRVSHDKWQLITPEMRWSSARCPAINDRVIPFFDAMEIRSAMLKDIRNRKVSFDRQAEIFAPLDEDELDTFFKLALKITKGPTLTESRVMRRKTSDTPNS